MDNLDAFIKQTNEPAQSLYCKSCVALESRLEEKEKVLKEIDWYLQVAKGREPSSECKVRIEGLVESALQEERRKL